MLGKVELILRDLAALVAGGDSAQLLQREQVGTGIHDAARDHDRGDVDTAERHEVSRQALVAARHKNARIKRRGLGMDLDHVGDHVTRGQRIVDAVMALRLAVADIGREVARAVPAGLGNTRAHLLDKLKKAGASRMRIAKRGLDDHLRLVQVLDAPTGAQAQRIHLGADRAKLARTRLALGDELRRLVRDRLLLVCRQFFCHDASLLMNSILGVRLLGASTESRPPKIRVVTPRAISKARRQDR